MFIPRVLTTRGELVFYLLRSLGSLVTEVSGLALSYFGLPQGPCLVIVPFLICICMQLRGLPYTPSLRRSSYKKKILCLLVSVGNWAARQVGPEPSFPALTHVKPVSLGEGIERKKCVYISAKAASSYSPRFPCRLLLTLSFLPSILFYKAAVDPFFQLLQTPGCSGFLFHLFFFPFVERWPREAILIHANRKSFEFVLWPCLGALTPFSCFSVQDGLVYIF